MPATKAPGHRLRRHRERKNLRLDDAAYKVREKLPHLSFSRETLRRYENGAVPEDRWDAEAIAALAEVYDCRRSDLSEIAAERMESLSDLLERTLRCTTAA